MSKQKVISVHHDRDTARDIERALQHLIDQNRRPPDVPAWARGVRVERVGYFRKPPLGGKRLAVQFVIVATEHVGH